MKKEDLIKAGVDYDGGVKRFAGKQQIYEKYLMMFFDNNALAELQNRLKADDYETAFHIAHDLKGSSGSLSMGKLYNTICELTELLRTGGRGEKPLLLCEQAIVLYREAEKAVRE